jgi:hypothetical protein
MDPRVAIAQDTIEQLGTLEVTRGTYLTRYTWSEKIPYEDQAQQHIDKISKDCYVCALGACFLSYIRLFNDVKVSDLVRGDRQEDLYLYSTSSFIKSRLSQYFTHDQLLLIEAAFEGWRVADYCSEQVCDFYDKHPDPKERLRAIMQNVIDNNGEFIP